VLRHAFRMPSAPSSSAPRRRLRDLGPGILFAAAAVGVSHLVQSTRAGAGYGFAMVAFVVLANVVKYPAFRFGPHYAAATGTSLLEGYRRQGRWALGLYALLTLGTMFTVQAAVTLVTSGLLIFLLDAPVSPTLASAILLLSCALLLGLGQYRWLERIGKGVVVALALCTVAATAIALPAVRWAEMPLWPSGAMLDPAGVLFVAALVGWMPAAVDSAVWQSLWSIEHGEQEAREGGARPGLPAVTFDFHVGYVGTALLSLCFVTLGAAVMYGSGATFAAAPAAFAGQLIDLYATTLGRWSRPVIALCAFLVMFSTTLTVVDGFPRSLAALLARMRGPEHVEPTEEEARRARAHYWVALLALSVGALLVIERYTHSLRAMVDVATTLSFLTAPLLAFLNHRAVTGPEVPAAARPRPWLVAASIVGIVAQAAFAVYYLWLSAQT